MNKNYIICIIYTWQAQAHNMSGTFSIYISKDHIMIFGNKTTMKQYLVIDRAAIT